MPSTNTNLQKTTRLIHTAKALKPNQFFHFILRRFLPPSHIGIENPLTIRNKASIQAGLKTNTLSDSYEGDHFRYLNQDLSVLNKKIDWNPLQLPLLWRYHHHYFDTLRDPNRSSTEKFQLISDWIANNPIKSKPGWESYPISLRVVNWVFFLLTEKEGLDRSDAIQESLQLQTLFLEANDERHILANHFFENIKALLFASVLFEGNDTERWRNTAEPWLMEQLVEQTLSDGGHYERSPHYHCFMLENYLDLYNLLSNNPQLFKPETKALVKRTAESGLAFLFDIIKPDGRIPLFNDSVHNLAPSADELSEYAATLFGYKSPENACEIHLINKPDSGIFGFRTKTDYLAIKCADIGPRYQPGHTHCDLLSFEWMHNNQDIIVDSGVYEYQPGDMRNYVRSTAAHNTITIDDEEQSEIWGEFRVARRAKKLTANITRKQNHIAFEGAYEGFYPVQGQVTHSRTLDAQLKHNKTHRVKIEDILSGQKKLRTIRNHLHFHPDITLKPVRENTFQIVRGDLLIGNLTVDAEVSCSLGTSWYCPEFGLKFKNVMLVMEKVAELPARMSYCIETIER